MDYYSSSEYFSPTPQVTLPNITQFDPQMVLHSFPINSTQVDDIYPFTISNSHHAEFLGQNSDLSLNRPYFGYQSLTEQETFILPESGQKLQENDWLSYKPYSISRFYPDFNSNLKHVSGKSENYGIGLDKYQQLRRIPSNPPSNIIDSNQSQYERRSNHTSPVGETVWIQTGIASHEFFESNEVSVSQLCHNCEPSRSSFSSQQEQQLGIRHPYVVAGHTSPEVIDNKPSAQSSDKGNCADKSKNLCKQGKRRVRTKAELRRKYRSRKEKFRFSLIRDGINRLKSKIPVKYPQEPLTVLKTLRGAIDYIKFLQEELTIPMADQ